MADQGPASNQTCQFCQEHEATHFCKCTGSLIHFCLDCCAKHNAKYPRAIHQITPIAVLSQNPEQYMRKYETLTKAATELRKNIERAEQCSIEFADLMTNCINYLTKYRTRRVQQLETEKKELALAIETAIQEASDYVDRGLEPVSALGRAVWTVPTEELQVFSYTVNPPDLSTLCPNWVKCHSRLNNPDELHPKPEEVPRDLFAAIWGETMHLYDLKTGETTHHSLPMYVYSGYVQVDRTTVLIVGEQVRTLDLLTLQTTPLPPLLTPRDFVGVAQMGSTVFAFGGIDGTPLKVCEKSSVPPTHWTPLPPMHYARSNFTPCAFKAFLYLVSAKNNRAVESFSSHNETFTVLSVSLPAENSFY